MQQVQLDRLVLLARLEILVLLVPQDRLEIPVLRVLQALREPQVQFLDLQVQQAIQALQGLQEPLERQALLEQQVRRDLPDLLVQSAQLVQLGQQVQLVPLVLQGILDQLDRKVL